VPTGGGICPPIGGRVTSGDEKDEIVLLRPSLPVVVISCAIRWYFRFQLSLRDVEELLFELGVVVTYETTRCRCEKFGAVFAGQAKATPASQAARGIWTRCS
jgi:hypothetical protein